MREVSTNSQEAVPLDELPGLKRHRVDMWQIGSRSGGTSHFHTAVVHSSSMSINAEVTKTGSESALSVIRKFSRRVQGTGLVKNARKLRYYERTKSKAVQKKRALKLIKRRAEYKQLVKEGKVVEAPARRSYTPRTESTGPAPRFGENTPIAR